ncbi:TetR/AcrR family transcriptional regulator [Pigmentiphaga aceris]|uniref:TetR/AcrR family transcriptional regulator n=1 Tax=Pigmentiphaga aceris TaxID=1940612 RepID=A0A5C0AUA6_9BURK|nr:TetR/AcrR family transcriptional regulator [Pigmentiphaga aceris]QEI05972.1 TetR/AcrR family transcriptional regulator [Pigmentiphaga aceris]
MRQSKRTNILDAAIRVINREGVTAVTFDSVAAEAALTRGGMLYHFASRDELIQGLNQYLANQWEENLEKSAGKPFEQTTADERLGAYIRVGTRAATRAELLFLLEFSKNPSLSEPWLRIIDRWAPPEPQISDDPQAFTRFMLRLAADGLWAYDYISGRPMDVKLRQHLGKELEKVLETSAAPSDGTKAEDTVQTSKRTRKKTPPSSGLH